MTLCPGPVIVCACKFLCHCLVLFPICRVSKSSWCAGRTSHQMNISSISVFLLRRISVRCNEIFPRYIFYQWYWALKSRPTRLMCDFLSTLSVSFLQKTISWYTNAVFLNLGPMAPWGGGTRQWLGGHRQIQLFKHTFAFCSLPPIWSKTFFARYARSVAFYPQLEMQVCNLILPTPVTFSSISVLISVIVSFQNALEDA